MNPINMYISGCNTDIQCYVGCPLCDWSMDGDLLTITTLLTPEERNSLRNAINPGKYEKWDVLFGRPYYIDTTYNSGNTIQIIPVTDTPFADFWSGNKIVVDSYREEPFGQPLKYYRVTISGYIHRSL